MSKQLGRRQFIQAGALASALAGTQWTATAPAAITSRRASKPVVISSANGNTHTNGGDETCVAKAFRLMTEGKDVLESLIAGVNILELDPKDSSVGYGGLPDADGNVTLDSCCMHGPLKRAGGVAALQGVRTPSLVAKAVADTTDHHLLVGQGAQDFARGMGFKIEEDLNSERSRKLWLEWKRRTDPKHYLNPAERATAGMRVGLEMVKEGKIDPDHFYGTINCNGVNANGDVCGVTTTSGLAWKIPGRVGDSPILGAGLWVDNEIGAAGSTGRGEANLYNLCSFLIVEQLRMGKSPKDAGMYALSRVKDATIEKRLQDEKGNPVFDLRFYVVNKSGEHAGCSMRSDGNPKYAVCDENGPRHEAMECLLD